MTCLAAITHEGRCYMAGDSSVSWDDNHISCDLPKIRKVNRYLYGCAGGARESDVLLTWGSPPKYPPGADVYQWVVNTFIPGVFERLSKSGVRRPEVDLILAINGTLWDIDNDGGSTRWQNYCALGSGMSLALGSLYTSDGGEWSPRKRLTKALQAAAKHDTSVLPPWRFRTI